MTLKTRKDMDKNGLGICESFEVSVLLRRGVIFKRLKYIEPVQSESICSELAIA